MRNSQSMRGHFSIAPGPSAVLALAILFGATPPALAVEGFERAMRDWMAKHGIVRGSLAVMREGRLALARGYGGRGANEPVAIWSLSKSITAACIAVLAQEGRLRFEEPIGRPLAGLFAKHGGAADMRLPRVTVAQLLTHRGGLPERTGDNRFAPGAVRILSRMPPQDARADMLMADIVKLPLAAEPGATFAYSNVGYLLLGQIVEAATGESYERACAARVLAPAGVAAPRLDAVWGRFLQATAGWALSGPEFLAYSRILTADGPGPFSAATHRWLRAAEGKWTDERRTVAYSLGLLVRPVARSEPTLFHGGAWVWRGRYAERRGTWFVRRGDGVSWFASFDGVASFGDAAIVGELHQALARAADGATSWPADDLFARMGIGPVARR